MAKVNTSRILDELVRTQLLVIHLELFRPATPEFTPGLEQGQCRIFGVRNDTPTDRQLLVYLALEYEHAGDGLRFYGNMHLWASDHWEVELERCAKSWPAHFDERRFQAYLKIGSSRRVSRERHNGLVIMHLERVLGYMRGRGCATSDTTWAVGEQVLSRRLNGFLNGSLRNYVAAVETS